jgi:glutathione synthase/RimK-type ligase-like ATP-grasp enzyme
MTRVALAGSEVAPAFDVGEESLFNALTVMGCTVDQVTWSAVGINWGKYDAVVVQACWDYHLRPRAFLEWAQQIEGVRARPINPVEILRWNHHKAYLLALRNAGLPVIPTVLLSGRDRDVEQASAALGSREIVIKPAVSASARHTYRVNAADVSRDTRVVELVASTDTIVQPYLPEIVDGEASLVFFDGVFSHAVLKRPAAGDFRVQSEHGGRVEEFSPPDWAIDVARRAIAAAPGLPAYARVDGLILGRTLLLMELELIEPELFFHTAPGSALRLARAVTDRLRR